MLNSSEIRVWCDGCYDFTHFGHANQMRQAKAMGNILVVGVHSDKDISEHKGPPVFNEEERYAIVSSIRWVDELVENSPYFPNAENTLDKYNCQFCVHGDDISIAADGSDAYKFLKAAGRYKECSRTAAVSTTALVERILAQFGENNIFKQNEISPWTLAENSTELPQDYIDYFADKIIYYGQKMDSNIRLNRNASKKVVYVSGFFDLFHIGHLQFLEAASKLGDHLIVGIYGDEKRDEMDSEDEDNGTNCKGLMPQMRPIMTVHERALTLLAFRQVSEVIIGAPRCINADFIRRFGIDLVARGKKSRFNIGKRGIDCFAEPQEMGIFRELDSGSTVTTQTIIERILRNVTDYERRNNKKQKKEIAAFKALQKMKLVTANEWMIDV